MTASPRTCSAPGASASTVARPWHVLRAAVVLLLALALSAVAAARPVVARAADGPAAVTVGDVYGGYSPDGGFLWLDDAELGRNLDLMKASGARWVRLGVVWSVVEHTRGTYDWRASDRVIAAARARGLEVLAIITYTPPWASGSDDDKVAPKDPTAVGPMARAAAERYAPQGVHTWEIWNEPNLRSTWAPRPDATAYASLLRTASSALKSADPSAQVVSGGLSPAGDAADGSSIAPLTFLKGLYAAGAGPSFDAVGLHPYCFPALPMQAGTESWNLFSRAPLFKQLMDQHGDTGKKVWFTEFGAPTGTSRDAVTDAVQSETLRSAFAQLPRWSWAGPLFLYSLRDNGDSLGDREQNFGLVRRDWTKKPAWDTAVAVLHGPVTLPASAAGGVSPTSPAAPMPAVAGDTVAAPAVTPPLVAPVAAAPAAPVDVPAAAAPVVPAAPTEAPATATAPATTPATVPVAAAVPAPLGPPAVPAAAAPPALLGPVPAPVLARPVAQVRLSALNARHAVNGDGPVERDLSVGGSRSRDGRGISVGGKRFADGLGVHTSSTLTYGLDGAVRAFTATIGVDDEVGPRGSVVFEVYADGNLRYRSARLTGRSAARAVTVPVLGAHVLRLVVRDGGDGDAGDHADWAGARLVR